MLNKINNLLFLITFWFLIIFVKLSYLFLIPCIFYKRLKKSKRNRILFLSPFFENNAGYQYRSKIWSELLNKNGFNSVVKNALSEKQFKNLKSKGNLNQFHLFFFIKRYFQVLSSIKYHKVIVRRELLLFNDYGNLFLDKLLLLIHPNAILDYDDNISEAKREPKKISWFGYLLLENDSKFIKSIKIYKNFICGSNYLKELNHKLNPGANSIFIPTCVNYDKFPKKTYTDSPIVKLGWIGGIDNLKYLDPIINDLNEVNKTKKIELIIISGKDYNNSNALFPINNIKWSINTQISNLYKIDIGLMPLPINERTKGKCGFKAIQYMGLGIPCIATSITANNDIIDHRINGYLVKEHDWRKAFYEIFNQDISKLGDQARIKVTNNFTFNSNLKKYIEFLKG